MKGTMMQFPLTLVPLVERAGKLFRNVEIVSKCRDGSIQRYTYGELYRRAQALAAELQEYGLEPGDRVATLMCNNYVITMLTSKRTWVFQ
jgi:fatty-acyl-CoA synthase